MSRTRFPVHRFPLLALALTGLTAVEAGAQQDPPPEYRVEVLVVEPASPRSDAWPVEALTDFDYAADPRRAARLAKALEATWPTIEAIGLPLPRPLGPRIGILPPDDTEPPSTDAAPDPVQRPPRWTALTPDPDALIDAEQRLTADGTFLPVTRISWLQTAGSPRRPRPARVHDEVIIRRDAPPEPAPASGRLDRTVSRTVDQRAIDGSAQPTPDPGSPEDGSVRSPAAPILRADPRLDGTIALVQRQFLHAELDLHWRVPLERPGQPGETGLGPLPDSLDAPPAIEPTAGWQVHRLQQSRVIRPDRWTWFDSERFGVLVRVTELPPLLPLPPPEPPPETTDALPADGTIEPMPDAPPGG